MARNQEKAQAMLNRWVQGKRDAAKGPVARRPYLASECDSVAECEKWRSQILRLIAKDVAVIQNAALGEHKIRDLNDRINKRMREKRAWEHQIKALGGNDYTRDGARVTDADGKRAYGTDGYFYFGAARELPGVRELFDAKAAANAAASAKPTRVDLHRAVNIDYFGFRDDDDGQLAPLEAKAEAAARLKATAKFEAQERERALTRVRALGLDKAADGTPLDAAALAQLVNQQIASAAITAAASSGSSAAASSSSSSSSVAMDLGSGASASSSSSSSAAAQGQVWGGDLLKAHVVLPTEQDLERAVLEKKRRDLLAKYGDASASSASGKPSASATPTAATADKPKVKPATGVVVMAD